MNDRETVTNYLSDGIEIIGNIRFQNDMIIDGKVEGEITSNGGKVTIGQKAYILGNISAGEVQIYGNVQGSISSDKCELKRQSKLVGDIKTQSLSMEEGAQLSGKTEIG